LTLAVHPRFGTCTVANQLVSTAVPDAPKNCQSQSSSEHLAEAGESPCQERYLFNLSMLQDLSNGPAFARSARAVGCGPVELQ
jgi:hypothetical protein